MCVCDIEPISAWLNYFQIFKQRLILYRQCSVVVGYTQEEGGGLKARRRLQTMLVNIIKRIARETLRMVTLIR